MGVNRERPHILVLPEDDANRQLANGFQLGIERNWRQFQVLPIAGGWTLVLQSFAKEHVSKMASCTMRSMVLLIDFDGDACRIDQAKAKVPEQLRERVFVLGTLTEPEDLKADLGSYEAIGSALAEDCRTSANATWGHELLRHNAAELARMHKRFRDVFFA